MLWGCLQHYGAAAGGMTRASAKLCAVFIDLSGTLHVDSAPIAGAPAALDRLRAAGIPVRFVSNTTTQSSTSLLNDMTRMGFKIEKEEMFTRCVYRYLYTQRSAPAVECNTTQLNWAQSRRSEGAG